MELKSFTPAQILMITKPFGASGTDLMKYSFLDLIFRGVLRVYKEWRLPHPRNKREQLYTLVSRGENFNSYIKSHHQNPFVDPFIDEDLEYQVLILIKSIYKKSGKGAGFKTNWVYKQLREDKYFYTSLGLKNFNLYFLNKKGKNLKKKANSIMDEAETILPKYAKSKNEKIKKTLASLGSNILILKCFNDELIASLKSVFKEIDNIAISKTSYFEKEDVFEILFYSFLDTMDYFDSSFESFDSSFDFSSSDFGGGDFGTGDGGGFDVGGGDW